MSEAEQAYWSAVAQVLPVLGLALVVEARSVIQSWQTRGGSRRTHWRMQIWMLVVAGVLITFGTSQALTSLLSDEPQPTWITWLISAGSGIALGVTLAIPLMNVLLISESATYQRWIEWSPKGARDVRHLFRTIRQVRRRAVRIRQQAFDTLVGAQELAEEQRWLLQRLSNLPSASPDDVDRVQNALRGYEDIVGRARAIWRDLIRREQNLKMYERELRRRFQEEDHDDRELMTRSVAVALSSADPVLGPAPVLPRSVFQAAPDDGGFLTDEPLPLPMPDLSPGDTRFITDAALLYTSAAQD